MKTNLLLAGAAFVVLSLSAAAASANTVYSNPYDGSGNGDCSWSTTCAAGVGRGDDFAGQLFTLTSASVITRAAFELVPGFSAGAVTDVNWGFVLADGPGGLPGTIIASGTDTVSSYGTGGNGSIEGFFNVGPQALGPGTYYFVLQGVSAAFNEYLAQGVAGSGAVNTQDGGVTWTGGGYPCLPGGACEPSIAISLFDANNGTVPEPATWALMLVGVGGLGAALRRKQRTALAAV